MLISVLIAASLLAPTERYERRWEWTPQGDTEPVVYVERVDFTPDATSITFLHNEVGGTKVPLSQTAEPRTWKGWDWGPQDAVRRNVLAPYEYEIGFLCKKLERMPAARDMGVTLKAPNGATLRGTATLVALPQPKGLRQSRLRDLRLFARDVSMPNSQTKADLKFVQTFVAPE